MGRPPTPVGAYGELFVTEEAPGRWRAEARVRTRTGDTKRPRRWRATKVAAVNAVKEAAAELGGSVSLVTASSRLDKVADLWEERIDQEVKDGSMSPETVRTYKSTLKNWIRPSLGKLQVRELSVAACEEQVLKARAEASYDTAKLVKSVLSGVCQVAVSHGAIPTNPAKSIGRITRGGARKEVVALNKQQRADLLAKLREYGPTRQETQPTKKQPVARPLGIRGRIWLDLPDIMEAMLATGVRLGELLALTPADVDLSTPEVRIDHHLLRVKGEGLVRRDGRKAHAPGLTLGVPPWSVPMWRRRVLASGGGPLFPSFAGDYLDPSNTINRIREAMQAVGYEWVTSHVWRKTVATVLDEAGLSTTAIADQLGNTPDVVEKHYRAKRKANPDAVAALEGMM